MTSAKTPVIFIFTDWYVPGFRAGGPIQSVFNLASLLSKNFVVKVITRDTDYGSTEPYNDVIPDTWTALSPQHEVLYLSAKNTTFKTIRNLCRDNKNDTILINGLFSFYFSVLPLFFAVYYGVKKVFVAVRGMLHQSALNVKPFKKQVFLSFARGFGLYKRATLLSTSEYENAEIKRILGKSKIVSAPNIPVLPFRDDSFLDKTFKSLGGELRLLFLGRISPEKNPVMVLKALREIRYKVHVKFAGAGIDEEYRKLFDEALKLLPDNIKVELLNELPHKEIMALFVDTDVMIMPSHGENFGHAIFESFANATPVIIGNNTPWKNIEEVKAGLEIDPKNEQEIAEAINSFIQMPETEYREWQRGALDKAIGYIDTNNFEKMYQELFTP